MKIVREWVKIQVKKSIIILKNYAKFINILILIVIKNNLL